MNHSSDESFERSPHDKEHPYTMVSNSLIRDKSISPECRLVLIYLLSHFNKWNIKTSQLINEFKGHLGKDQIYKIITEAIAAGYMKKVEYTKNNLKRVKYFVSEHKSFRMYLLPDFQDTGFQDTENTDDKEGTSKEIRNPPPLSPPKKKPDKPRVPDKPQKREEEDYIFDCLRGNVDLSEMEMVRLTKSFSEGEVYRALKIASTQEIKKTLMHLLLNILKHPEKWEYREDAKSSPEKLALKYNSMIEKKHPDMFKENQKSIKKGIVWVMSSGGDQQIALKSSYAEKEIMEAFEYLQKRKK